MNHTKLDNSALQTYFGLGQNKMEEGLRLPP